MSNANIKKIDLGHYAVSGELVFDAVVSLLDSSEALFDGKSNLVFNLKHVDKTDSAGLALLVEWARIASHKKQEIEFCDLPKQLLDIARVSGLDELLPIV